MTSTATTSNKSTNTSFIDYYHVFGLKPDWEIDRLRQELVEIYGETLARVNAASGKKLEDINQRLEWITEARQILLDPDAKAKYDQDLAEWKRTATPEQKAAAASIPTIQELWQLIDEGRYLDAIQIGKQLVEHTPDKDEAWEAYGYANYLWQDYRTAIYAAEQAINCNPKKADYYADISQYLAAVEQWDEAVIQLNRAIHVEPNHVGYKLVLSNIYIKHKTWSDAEAVLQGVLSQEPSNQTARSFMAIIIGSRAEERISEVIELTESGKKKDARRVLKDIKNSFEEAKKLAANNSDLLDLLSSESIMVRRTLGVNFYQRCLGFVIDIFMILPGFFIMSIDSGSNAAAKLFGIVTILSIWGYSWIWLAYKNNGQDLTKRLLGMQIVTDNDSIPSLGNLFGRAIIKPFAIALGFLFPFLLFYAALFEAFIHNDGTASGALGLVIGLIIGFYVMFFRILFDLFFVTNKELMPNMFGFLLFFHEHLTKTTVIASTKDDFINLGEYHWY